MQYFQTLALAVDAIKNLITYAGDPAISKNETGDFASQLHNWFAIVSPVILIHFFIFIQ
jgi:hypothetical protein